MSDDRSIELIDGDISPEEAFIGAILDGGLSEFQVYESSITEEDFQDGRLRAIFERLKQFSRDGQDFDVIVLADEMKGMAPEYILKLVDSCVFKSKSDMYARQIKENSIRRKMLDAMRKASITPTSELITSIQDDIWRYQALSYKGWDLNEALKGSLDYIEKRMSGIIEFAPGFIDLDIMLGEFERGDVIIIGGRPGHCKSSLSVNLCMNQLKTGKNVYLIDLETSYTQMLNRFIGLEAGVAPKDMKDGHLSSGDLSKIIAATAKIREYNLTIHSNPSTQLSDIASGVKASNADIVFLDYINLLESYGKPQSTNDRITEQIRGLKKLALHLDIPFVVLSQLNRKLEERDDKKPRLSDFRDSGSLEQVGDVILATYWAHKYDESAPENEIMIRVLKQKVGDTSDIMMEWNKTIMRFRNYSGGTFG